jgi:hypothetical protein
MRAVATLPTPASFSAYIWADLVLSRGMRHPNASRPHFLPRGKQRFAKSLISFRPRVGDFYIFPGFLPHDAESFRGKGERIASFNAVVGSSD